MDDGTLNDLAKKEAWKCHYKRQLNVENAWQEIQQKDLLRKPLANQGLPSTCLKYLVD